MTLCWKGKTLWITFLPVDSMGRIAACTPAQRGELEVWAALLAGVRVYVSRDALEYRRYRKSAPLGTYRKCVALERELRELGVIVIRHCGRKSLGDEKRGPTCGTDLFGGASAQK